jgi:hypothetical protein
MDQDNEKDRTPIAPSHQAQNVETTGCTSERLLNTSKQRNDSKLCKSNKISDQRPQKSLSQKVALFWVFHAPTPQQNAGKVSQTSRTQRTQIPLALTAIQSKSKTAID